MRDPIKLALPFLMPEEHCQILEEAIDLLTELGQSAPQDDIAQVIELADDNADAQLTTSRIMDITDFALTGLVREHGVTLIDEASLRFKTALLRTLSSLDNYVIPMELSDILKSETDNEECVARLMPVITDISIEEALENIVEVQDYTIRRINEVVTERLKFTEEAPVTVSGDKEQRIQAINQLISKVGKDHLTLAYQFLDAGVGVGIAFTSIFGQVLSDLDSLDENRSEVPVERFGAEVLGLVLISDEPLSSVKIKAIKTTNELIDDTARLIRLETIIGRLCSEIGL